MFACGRANQRFSITAAGTAIEMQDANKEGFRTEVSLELYKRRTMSHMGPQRTPYDQKARSEFQSGRSLRAPVGVAFCFLVEESSKHLRNG